MIIIDIEVPMLSRHYDFQIDENVLIDEVIVEIADMICRREQCRLTGDEKDLRLWNMQTEREIDRGRTAGENGLRTGSEVMLA